MVEQQHHGCSNQEGREPTALALLLPSWLCCLPGLAAAPPWRAMGEPQRLVIKTHSLFRRVAHFLVSASQNVTQ